MESELTYVPPARRLEPGVEVRRRHVLYVPGYDPDSATRARMLFVREMIRYARRFGLTERSVTKPVALSGPVLRWNVQAGTGDWTTRTTFDVLRWDDIVRRDFERPLGIGILLLFVAFAHSLLTGVALKFFRLSWKFGGVILYPLVMVGLLGAAGTGVAIEGEVMFDGVGPVPAPIRALLDIALFLAVFALVHPLYERWFVWHLLHDWVFNWQHGNGWRADYESRVDAFARHLVEIARAGKADEIVVIGHSSGSVMAMEVVARALEACEGLGQRSAVALLTVGSCLPLVALNPRARRCRDGIARIIASPRILWVEYQAPQDWLNFAGFNPVRHLDLGLPEAACLNPLIRSAQLREIMNETSYRAILYRPFRLHFQFLMGNERPGEYDYVMMMVGPLSLADRVHEPGRAFARIFGAARTGPAAEVMHEPERSDAALARVIGRRDGPMGDGLLADGL